MWIMWRIHDLIEVAYNCAYSFIYTLFHDVELYSRMKNDHFRCHTARIWLIIPIIISFSLNLTRQLMVHHYNYMSSELVLSFFCIGWTGNCARTQTHKKIANNEPASMTFQNDMSILKIFKHFLIAMNSYTFKVCNENCC